LHDMLADIKRQSIALKCQKATIVSAR